MNPGYVYILTNDAMPGLVKIGRTSRDVDLRASELWQTGVPQRFEVYSSERTFDCVQLEAFVHGDLRRHRVTKQREFFSIEPHVARERLEFWANDQASSFIRDHFNCCTAVPWLEYVSIADIDRLSEETGQSSRVITEAMAGLSADEITPSIQRVLEEHRQEEIASLKRAGIPEDDWGMFLNE